MLLGVSGGYRAGGILDRALREVLEASGRPYRLVHLAELAFRPCRGCLDCVRDNVCSQKDQLTAVLEELRTAAGLVVAAAPHTGALNGMTKAFLERIYSFKHRRMLTRHKVGAAVVAGFRDAQAVADYLEHWFRFYRFDFRGAVLLPGTIPCSYCGYGRACAYSNLPGMDRAGLTDPAEGCCGNGPELAALGSRLGA
ncbi:MAG: flavodoxin family protein [Thermaerobacter sp.]|nr:flavodoxin family protein [Thermaerobacter sp.]